MKRHGFLILAMCATLLGCRSSEKLPNKESEIFGKADLEILSKADIAGNGKPFLWNCYSLETVKPSFRTWRDADPLGPHDVIVTMCYLKISVKDDFSLTEYSDTRAREISDCNKFMSAWRKLTTGETKVCLAGRPIKNSVDVKQEPQKPTVDWIWDKIKTRKGCYGFWDGYDC